MFFKIPEQSLGLWSQLSFWGIDMPWFEANKAPDVKVLFNMRLVNFVKSRKPEPAVCISLTAKGWLWKIVRALFFFLY